MKTNRDHCVNSKLFLLLLRTYMYVEFILSWKLFIVKQVGSNDGYIFLSQGLSTLRVQVLCVLLMSRYIH